MYASVFTIKAVIRSCISARIGHGDVAFELSSGKFAVAIRSEGPSK